MLSTLPTVKASEVIFTDQDNSYTMQSDVTVGQIRTNPYLAQVTIRNGTGCLSRQLNDGDIAMIDTSASRINADGCVWLFEHSGRVLLRELQIMFTHDRQYRAVMDGEIFKADDMQVIGKVTGTYTPFDSGSVRYQ